MTQQNDVPSTSLFLPECTRLDVGLVIDASGSVSDSEDNWNTLKTFITSLIGELDIGLDRVRVGAIKYSTTAEVEFGLDQYSSKEALTKAINEMENLGRKTNTADALR